jgi:hypothetical protein
VKTKISFKTIFKILRDIKQVITKVSFYSGFDNKFTVHYKKTPNLLSELCDKYGSDKGSINSERKPFTWKPHNYTDYYEHLFASKREFVTKVFECGIGTNNVYLPSNMTATGQPGASLRVWRDYFVNATIYGADTDRNILFTEARIETDYMNQLEPLSIQEFWSNIEKKNFDIMIDDGLHTFEAGVSLFENSIQYLDENGIYVIEDIDPKNLLKFQQYFVQTSFKVQYVSFKSKEYRFGDSSIISVRR